MPRDLGTISLPTRLAQGSLWGSDLQTWALVIQITRSSTVLVRLGHSSATRVGRRAPEGSFGCFDLRRQELLPYGFTSGRPWRPTCRAPFARSQ